MTKTLSINFLVKIIIFTYEVPQLDKQEKLNIKEYYENI